jgi:hypothetical protein
MTTTNSDLLLSGGGGKGKHEGFESPIQVGKKNICIYKTLAHMVAC